MSLIANWKEAWKMTSFQLSIILIVLETVNAMLASMPEEYASYLRPFLLATIPIARVWKQTNLKLSRE